jgi:hypothetical protein
VGVGEQRPTKIDRGLLEHLSGDLMPPPKAGHLLGDGPVWSGDEDTPGGLTTFPGIEGVDQVEPRPWDVYLRFCPLGGKSIGDQPKTLVVGEPGRPGVSGEHRRLRREGASANRNVVCRMASRNVPDGCDSWERTAARSSALPALY